jgi:hypothetical protein
MASAASSLATLTSHRPTAEVLPRVLPLAPVPPPSPIPVPAPAPYLTTADPARSCGFKTPSAIRKAPIEGRIFPVSRRGGKGTWVYAVADLHRFTRGEPPLPSAATASLHRTLRLRLPQEEPMSNQEKRTLFKASRFPPEPLLPRVWQRKDVRHVARARVIDPSSARIVTSMSAPTVARPAPPA